MRRLKNDYSSSTAVTVLITARTLCVGHLGDSRAVLISNGGSGGGGGGLRGADLTRDHKPEDPEERAYVRRAPTPTLPPPPPFSLAPSSNSPLRRIAPHRLVSFCFATHRRVQAASVFSPDGELIFFFFKVFPRRGVFRAWQV